MPTGITVVVGWGLGLACAGLMASLVLVLAETVRIVVQDGREARGAPRTVVHHRPPQAPR